MCELALNSGSKQLQSLISRKCTSSQLKVVENSSNHAVINPKQYIYIYIYSNAFRSNKGKSSIAFLLLPSPTTLATVQLEDDALEANKDDSDK